MRPEQSRQHFEQLILSVAAEVIDEDAEIVPDPLDSRPGEARARFTSRIVPDRKAGVRLDDAWLEAAFFQEPTLSIVRIDDYADDDEYAAERLRELMRVVRAYMRGEGTDESRRTILGRRRHQLRFEVDGREWLAR